ncbi:MAG TPA: hypothetical protein QGH10_10810 [Armatimonadota bacterium]|nr:hypothetical protein [Armatimonadota bacterium]
MKKPLSPAKVQALIWLGAAVVAAIFAAIAWPILTKVPEPEPPAFAAEPAPATTELAERAAAPATEEADLLAIDEPIADPPVEPAPAPDPPSVTGPARAVEPAASDRSRGDQALTEKQFVDVSAMLILASEWATEAGDGQEALDQASDSILRRRGIDKAEFEAMSESIAQDPERLERILDEIETRVTALRVGGIDIGTLREPHRPGRPAPE